MKIYLLLTLLIFSNFSISQNITISGSISDKASGELLIGATVIDLISKKGTSSNTYGFYSITLPKGEVNLHFSFVGHKAITKKIFLNNNYRYNIELGENLELKEFTVLGNESEKIQNKTQMSSFDLSMDKVNSLPVLLGEKDIMKTIQLLPGVQSGSEGSSGLYVRGGGPDQNLILLDGSPIYNASHLFGFFSVFNADAIKSVKLIKGGFPSRYGGRLSSVIDIRMKEGNLKEFHAEGSIGLISSKITLEGPIIKNKTSFIVSARRTYIDILAQPLIKVLAKADDPESKLSVGYYFYDINGKINHKFSNRSRLYFSNYFGNDKFYYKKKYDYSENGITDKEKIESKIKWGNIISSLKWNYIINDKLFSNVTLRYSRYKFNVGFSEEYEETGGGNADIYEKNSFDYISKIRDWSGNIDFDFIPNANHYVKFGVGDMFHKFTPGVNQIKYTEDNNSIDTTFGSIDQFSNEFSSYIEDDYKINDLLKINGGIHFSGFLVNNKNYFSLQPRVSLRYLIDENKSIKTSYSKMTQFVHLLTNTSIGLPTDLWVPATDKIKPQNSHQIAIGMASTYKKKYQISIESYYKWMNNLIEYKDGASFLSSSEDWQNKVESGKGWSYGGEILLEKKQGKTTGWIGYTLSWTNRQFDKINFGEKFPYKYDRRHDLGIAITHKFEKYKSRKGREKWIDIGLVWVYGTGNAITLGTERYTSIDVSGQNSFNSEVEHIENRNNYRMPSYHRLDIGINIHTKMKKHEKTWSFGLYNAYSRNNPFYLYFSENYTQNGIERNLYQVSLFPIIPSFSYSFKF